MNRRRFEKKPSYEQIKHACRKEKDFPESNHQSKPLTFEGISRARVVC